MVADLLGRLENVRKTGSGWLARCPAHDDRHASLSVSEGREERLILKCHAGCATEDVIAALGLAWLDLFPERGEGGRVIPFAKRSTLQQSDSGEGCTLEQYAQARRLRLDFLRSLGLTQIVYLGKPAVRIPYLDETGAEIAVRFRVALTGAVRVRAKAGSSLDLYGLDRIAVAREAGSVVIVEGESDAHTLWLHEIAAVALPGADTWNEERDAPRLDGIHTVYVVIEPDAGGQAVLRWLRRSAIRDRTYLVRLRDAKDPSELYLRDPDQFVERFREALAAALPWAEHERQERARERERLEELRSRSWRRCEMLARAPEILDLFARELRRAGLVGEDRAAKLIYLQIVSRLLERPLSIVVKGPSAGGKSFTVEMVLPYFPASAYYALSAMSERALAYSEEPLSHRMLVLYEAAGLEGDFVSYLVRSLLSEGCVRYETVEKTAEGMRARLIERPGPTGLLLTTTRVHLHPENETRLLSVPVTDTQEQTAAVLLALAQEDRARGDYAEWHALQEWLEAGSREVTIPFAEALARLVPPVAVRLRRDFNGVLTLIRAHALLHQASRERDGSGRIGATIADYAAVRDLVADLVADGVEATVSPTLRETVAAVATLSAESGDSVTVAALAAHLKLDKSAASRRQRVACERGYLRNLEQKPGKPARLVLGGPLPEDVTILPAPEELAACCTVARDPGGISRPPSPRWPPLPGDDGFRAFLNHAVEAGHITERERHERSLWRDLIIGTRRPAGEAHVLAEVADLVAQGVLQDGAA